MSFLLFVQYDVPNNVALPRELERSSRWRSTSPEFVRAERPSMSASSSQLDPNPNVGAIRVDEETQQFRVSSGDESITRQRRSRDRSVKKSAERRGRSEEPHDDFCAHAREHVSSIVTTRDAGDSGYDNDGASSKLYSRQSRNRAMSRPIGVIIKDRQRQLSAEEVESEHTRTSNTQPQRRDIVKISRRRSPRRRRRERQASGSRTRRSSSSRSRDRNRSRSSVLDSGDPNIWKGRSWQKRKGKQREEERHEDGQNRGSPARGPTVTTMTTHETSSRSILADTDTIGHAGASDINSKSVSHAGIDVHAVASFSTLGAHVGPHVGVVGVVGDRQSYGTFRESDHGYMEGHLFIKGMIRLPLLLLATIYLLNIFFLCVAVYFSRIFAKFKQPNNFSEREQRYHDYGGG